LTDTKPTLKQEIFRAKTLKMTAFVENRSTCKNADRFFIWFCITIINGGVNG